MAEKKRPAKPRFVTPVGVAYFPYILEPDTKYNAEGVYQTELILPGDTTVSTAKGENLGSFEDWLNAANEEAYKKAVEANKGKKDKKGKAVVVQEADAPYRIDDDGKFIPKFKLNATGKGPDGPFTQKPAVFDAKGKPVELEKLWGGSLIKVSFELVEYFMESTKAAGVSLRMKAVQVIELRAGGAGADSSAYGFGEEEGFEAEEDEAEGAGFSSEGETAYDDNGGDF
ncbi:MULTISPECIES: hypothetical protein [unclassified Thioalkalivibrio]|uniref:hypothetical protein n=1 Tax=unclassified Thioalkalivibrio TaxID=2621013 RepID=UPI00035C3C57|nr:MULTISPECIES: hypothetical protein [unclassified Thioalkalivibrio]